MLIPLILAPLLVVSAAPAEKIPPTACAVLERMTPELTAEYRALQMRLEKKEVAAIEFHVMTKIVGDWGTQLLIFDKFENAGGPVECGAGHELYLYDANGMLLVGSLPTDRKVHRLYVIDDGKVLRKHPGQKEIRCNSGLQGSCSYQSCTLPISDQHWLLQDVSRKELGALFRQRLEGACSLREALRRLPKNTR